jgi:hypothetical protein
LYYILYKKKMSVFRNLYVKKNLNVSGITNLLDVNTSGNMSVGGDMDISGNLVVNGATTSVSSTNVLISDRHLYLNKDQITKVGQTSGIVSNVKVDSQLIDSATNFPTTTTIRTVGSDTFLAGQKLIISSSSNTSNNIMVTVVSHSGTLLTVLETLVSGVGTANITGPSVVDSINGSFTTNTVVTTGSTVYTAGDYIQIDGANKLENNGLFEVVSHIGTSLTINTNTNFVQTAFLVDSTVAGDIRKVFVSIIQASATGDWQTARASNATSINFKALILAGDTLNSDRLNLTANNNQLVLDSDGSSSSTISSVQTLGNKTFVIPDVESGEFIMARGVQNIIGKKTMTAPVLNDAKLSLSDTSGNSLTIAPNALGNDYSLTLEVDNANRKLALGGDIVTAGDFSTVGSSLILTQTGPTNVTLPTVGTLATLAGTEDLSNKTMVLPKIADASAAYNYSFVVSPLTLDVTVKLPLLLGNDEFVFKDHLQILTNKTLTAPILNDAKLSLSDIGGNKLTIAPNLLSDDYSLTLGVSGADRALTLGGDVVTAGDFSTAGSSLILTQTGPTNVILPTTGTLATLAGTEDLSNKTLSLASVTTESVQTVTAAAVTPTSHIVDCDATAASITVTLPLLSSSAGKTFVIHKKNNSNTVIVSPSSTELLGGTNTAIVLDTQYQSLRVTGTVSNWVIG